MSKVVAFELDDGTVVPLMIECPNCSGDKVNGCHCHDSIECEYATSCDECDGSGEKRNPALEWSFRCISANGKHRLFTTKEGPHFSFNPGEGHQDGCRWVSLGLTP